MNLYDEDHYPRSKVIRSNIFKTKGKFFHESQFKRSCQNLNQRESFHLITVTRHVFWRTFDQTI